MQGQPDPGRRPRVAVCKPSLAVCLAAALAAGGLSGCQTATHTQPSRAYQPLQQQGQPARSLMMPPLSTPVSAARPAPLAGRPNPNAWYTSRLDHGPAAFAGFRGVRITESQTRTFDQQQIFSGRVRDNFRQQRVTRTRVITSQ